MALKTDYKDDVFSGNRKYNMITNDDGTISFEDVTEYEQTGDTYGAGQINNVNNTVNSLFNFMEATLKAGKTTLTFTNENFSDSTIFRFYNNGIDTYIKEKSLSGKTLTLTFDKQDSDMPVKVQYINL